MSQHADDFKVPRKILILPRSRKVPPADPAHRSGQETGVGLALDSQVIFDDATGGCEPVVRWPEWVEVGDERIVTSYADPASIRRAGNLAKMWDLLDFKAVQARPYGTPYRSQKTQQEYDCKEERARTIQLLRYF